MTLPISETRILLHDGHFVRERIDRDVLAPTHLALSALKEQAPVRITNLYPLGDRFISLYKPAERDAILYTVVPKLPLKLAYHEQSTVEKLMYPHIDYSQGWPSAKGTDKVIDASFTWDHTRMGTLFFMVAFASGTPIECYLLNHYKGSTHVIPYANLFTDGRLCMGNEWTNNKTGGFTNRIGMFHHAWASFNTAVMNNHLIHRNFDTIYAYDPVAKITEAQRDPGLLLTDMIEACPSFLTDWGTTP